MIDDAACRPDPPGFFLLSGYLITAIAMSVTMPAGAVLLGAASWYLVERKAIALKHLWAAPALRIPRQAAAEAVPESSAPLVSVGR